MKLRKRVQPTVETTPSVGYVELLRKNRQFRMLWLGQVVSQMGDWFDTIAVYTLALQLTGSSRSVALIMVARFLPSVVMGPLSGVVADRFSRRSIMIASDIMRALVVLGFLFVRRPDQMWLVYVLTVLQLAFSAFFEPAKTAALDAIGELHDEHADVHFLVAAVEKKVRRATPVRRYSRRDR